MSCALHERSCRSSRRRRNNNRQPAEKMFDLLLRGAASFLCGKIQCCTLGLLWISFIILLFCLYILQECKQSELQQRGCTHACMVNTHIYRWLGKHTSNTRSEQDACWQRLRGSTAAVRILWPKYAIIFVVLKYNPRQQILKSTMKLRYIVLGHGQTAQSFDA